MKEALAIVEKLEVAKLLKKGIEEIWPEIKINIEEWENGIGVFLSPEINEMWHYETIREIEGFIQSIMWLNNFPIIQKTPHGWILVSQNHLKAFYSF